MLTLWSFESVESILRLDDVLILDLKLLNTIFTAKIPKESDMC